MVEYEAPAITELGSVAEFTQGFTAFGINFDNLFGGGSSSRGSN